jgi:hypothetical protein
MRLVITRYQAINTPAEISPAGAGGGGGRRGAAPRRPRPPAWVPFSPRLSRLKRYDLDGRRRWPSSTPRNAPAAADLATLEGIETNLKQIEADADDGASAGAAVRDKIVAMVEARIR